LDKAQRKKNRQPKGHIFDRASDKPNPELRVIWKETKPATHKVEPSPIHRVSKCLDPDDKEQDSDEFWASVAADTTTLAGRLGLLAFTMTTSEPADHHKIMEMEESKFGALAKADDNKKPTSKKSTSTKPKRETPKKEKSLSLKPSQSEAEEKKKKKKKKKKKLATPEPQSPKMEENHLPAPASVATPVRKHIKLYQSLSSAFNFVRATSWGFLKSAISVSSSSEDEEPQAEAKNPKATTQVYNRDDAMALLERLHRHEDAIARSTAITVRYTNNHKDMFQQALSVMAMNVYELTNSDKAHGDGSAYSIEQT
jgi:hypothetical protein